MHIRATGEANSFLSVVCEGFIILVLADKINKCAYFVVYNLFKNLRS